MFPGLVVGEDGAETSSSRRSHAHVRRSEHGQSVQELRQVRVDRRESVAMQLPAGMVGRDVRHDDRYEEISSLSLSLLNLRVTSSSDYCYWNGIEESRRCDVDCKMCRRIHASWMQVQSC